MAVAGVCGLKDHTLSTQLSKAADLGLSSGLAVELSRSSAHDSEPSPFAKSVVCNTATKESCIESLRFGTLISAGTVLISGSVSPGDAR